MIITPASVARTSLTAFVTRSLRQLLHFRLQQLAQRFLDASSYQFLDFPLDYILVQYYNLLKNGLQAPFKCVVSQLHSTKYLHAMSIPFVQFTAPFQQERKILRIRRIIVGKTCVTKMCLSGYMRRQATGNGNWMQRDKSTHSVWNGNFRTSFILLKRRAIPPCR